MLFLPSHQFNRLQITLINHPKFSHLTHNTAKPLTELKLEGGTIDTDHVDCKSNFDVIDECGLQQGFSHRFPDFAYPTNHSALLTACKRQTDALKCLRAYSKCLPPLSKQVLIAMVNSRQKYNKRICSEKPTEAALKFLELNQCMQTHKVGVEKGIQAELNSIATPEAIVNSKIDSLQERIKHSCCSVAKVRKEFMDTTVPHCKQYSQVSSEIIDSYLGETVGIICPDFDSKLRYDCDKLPKLATPKSTSARFFVRPILNVIQTLA